MVKIILKLTAAAIAIYLFLELFKYFSYWGLGAGIIILFILAILFLIDIVASFILKSWEKILATVKRLKTNAKWQAFVQAVRRKWPRLYRFVEQRLQSDSPAGLYLTIGTIASAVFFLFFLGIIQDIWFKDPLYFADLRVIYLLHAVTSEKLNYFFVFFTNLANTLPIIAGLILVSAYLFLTKNVRAAQYLIATTAGGFLISSLAKIIFHRPRPITANLIASPASYSLPSGHALISVCFYGFIAHLLFKSFKNKIPKLTVLISFLLLALLIGISRAYLGVHYPSDVLAGWYLGFVVLTIGITFSEIKNKFDTKKIAPLPAKKILLAALTVIFLIFSFFSANQIKIVQPTEAATETDLGGFLKKSSLYSEDLFGQKMEPVSFIVVGDKEQLIKLFTAAGWSQAENPGFKNFVKLSSAIAKNTSYPTAPMTPSFYQSKTNDLAFEKLTESNTARQRHHTRYWKTDYKISGEDIWVATASFDQGVEISPIIQLPVHEINPDIDTERQFIFDDFLKTSLLVNHQKIDLVGPVKGINAAGDKFTTDGQAYVIYL